MNRGIISISESGLVTMPSAPVWMSLQEIADMYNVGMLVNQSKTT